MSLFFCYWHWQRAVWCSPVKQFGNCLLFAPLAKGVNFFSKKLAPTARQPMSIAIIWLRQLLLWSFFGGGGEGTRWLLILNISCDIYSYREWNGSLLASTLCTHLSRVQISLFLIDPTFLISWCHRAEMKKYFNPSGFRWTRWLQLLDSQASSTLCWSTASSLCLNRWSNGPMHLNTFGNDRRGCLRAHSI